MERRGVGADIVLGRGAAAHQDHVVVAGPVRPREVGSYFSAYSSDVRA